MNRPIVHNHADPEEVVELHELLGEGAYGAVYRATRIADGKVVAVKIIPVDNNIKKEVNIMMKSSSPFLVQLHECYFKDKEAWLLMDYCAGGSSSDIIEACQITFSEDETREAMAWCLLGLQYLHSNRRLHRDVKAGNVLLTIDGHAKLGDFGVSKEVSTVQDKLTVIGTPYWMAPEVIQEVPYDGRADLWSLGITAIEMVEGNPPLHKVHPMRALFMIPSKPPPKLKEPDKWSKHFKTFIDRILVKDPQERASMEELLCHPFVHNQVESILRSGGLEGTPCLRALVRRHLDELNHFRRANYEARSDQKRGQEEATMRVVGPPGGGKGNFISPHGTEVEFASSGSLDSSGSTRRFREKVRALNNTRSSSNDENEHDSDDESDEESDDESTGSCVRFHESAASFHESSASFNGPPTFSVSIPSEASFNEEPISLSPLHHQDSDYNEQRERSSSSLAAAARYFETSADISSGEVANSKSSFESNERKIANLREKLIKLDADYALELNALRSNYNASRRELMSTMESLVAKGHYRT